MKSNKILLLLAFVLTLSALFLVSPVQASIDGGYVGTATCLGCHDGVTATDKTSFTKTGHPYKYQYAGGAPVPNWVGTFQTPPVNALGGVGSIYLPLIVDDGLGRLDWSAIEYTLGGWGWKLRWGVRDTVNLCPGPDCDTGYVWDADDDADVGNQYRLLTNDWNDMDYNAPTGKKYSCAICHNTNGTSSYDTGCITALGSGRTQPWAETGLNTTDHGGFYSEWTFDGVQCEACHGPGEVHAGGGAISVLETSPGVEICAKCHIRSSTVTVNPDGTGGNKYGGECGGDTGTDILTNGASMGPSAASTSSRTPSTMFMIRSTSPPKSACPGVSTIFIFTF